MTRGFKLSPQALSDLEKEQAKNQRKNEVRAEKIRKLGQAVNHRNLLKMRLWEELNPADPMDRRCPYTGEVINVARLLSDEVDIDHLVPFQDCWDDSAANKVVRSEEHTSELQSLMRISYAVFCLKKKKTKQ